jgi:ADP-ribose pyrophosphatase
LPKIDAEPTKESRYIFQGKVVSLRVDTVHLPNGGLATREIVEHSDAVAVVPVDSYGNAILVRQYRKAVEEILLEVPAGDIDVGETPEAAAQRELLEETGFTAKEFESLGGFYTTPGFCTERMHAFLATGLTPGEARPEFDESIEVVSVPLGEIRKMLREGEFQDAKSIVSLLLVLDRLGASASV